MLYTDEKFDYSLEKCMWKHSEEWKKIFFNTLTIKISLLSVQGRIKPKEVDIEGMLMDVVNDAIQVFDKYLINTKGYKKIAIEDEYDGTDTTLYQNIDYQVLLSPFEDFFYDIEVK